jgi:hypothetical protein
MSDRDDARALLAMAAKDALALEAMSDRSTFADEIFGFHAPGRNAAGGVSRSDRSAIRAPACASALRTPTP